MADNNKVTIDAAFFYELFRKANETDRICKECRAEHTAEEFNALERERDELTVKMDEALNVANDFKQRLAEADQCIEDCFGVIDRAKNYHDSYDKRIEHIIRAYREQKEAER